MNANQVKTSFSKSLWIFATSQLIEVANDGQGCGLIWPWKFLDVWYEKLTRTDMRGRYDGLCIG